MHFDEPTLHKLNQLSLIAHQIRAGFFKGDRKSSKRGRSIEFADYRNYTPGDDLRHLDWNVFARLDRPFLKLMQEEEDLAVNILLDSSPSMDWGEGETNKRKYAIRLAAALAAIALGAGDQLKIQAVIGDHVSGSIGPIRSSHQLSQVFNFLEHLPIEPKGLTRLDDALRKMSLSIRRPGLTFLISDLFSPQGFIKGLNALRARGFEIILLHILCPVELNPPYTGDMQLIDIETGDTQEITVDGGMKDLYRRKFTSWQAEIQKECRKRRIGYFLVNTSTAWEKLVLFEMRQAGFIK